MLINFSFSNFKSYRDEQQFSMQRPTNAQKHEEGDWERMDISTVAGIYGGNASGKSAFIEAFRFVCDYVANGFDLNYDLSDRLRPFMLDAVFREMPSEFLVEFLGTDGKRYSYELSVQGNEIEYETLRAYNGNRSIRVFEREHADEGYLYRYGRAFSGARRTFERMARPSTPYLSVLFAGNAATVRPAYEFFRNSVGFFQADLFECELSNIRRGLRRGTATARALARLMASADLGISFVKSKDLLEELQESSQQPGDPREGTYEDLASGVLALSQLDLSREERRGRAETLAKTKPEPRYEFSFTHRGANGFEESFTEEEESKGTLAALAFFSLALRLLSARSVGFIDEVDASLHPNYVQELVRLFKDPLTNPHQSQLIFTTHDVSLITRTGADRRVLDQDQIWLVEKNAEGASTIYPVTSIQQSRWDENFGRNYIHGVYGASPTPHFHEAFAQVASELGDAIADLAKDDKRSGV